MSVPPINPTDLAHNMGDPAAIGKHPMRRPMVNADDDATWIAALVGGEHPVRAALVFVSLAMFVGALVMM